MKTFFKIVLATLLITHFSSYATTYTSAANGNWEDTSTWSPIGVPTTGDIVIIGNHVITVNSNATCASITCLGSNEGSSTLTINSGAKLTLSGNFIVEPTNSYDNNSYINGVGELEIQNLQVGFSTLINTFPTTTKLTTLYVDALTNFKINGNLISTTPVNTNPVSYNESRIRHRSGTIELVGVFSISVGGSGPSALGYRTDNTLQGDAKIILRNINPNLSDDAITGQNFSGCTLHIIPTEADVINGFYSIPGGIYKHLILDFDQYYYPTSTPTIKENGILEIKKGKIVLSNIIIKNNTEIILEDGQIGDKENLGVSGPYLLIDPLNKYNITYNQSTQTISSGIEMAAGYYNGNTFFIRDNSIDNLTINNTNSIEFRNVSQLLNAPDITNDQFTLSLSNGFNINKIINNSNNTLNFYNTFNINELIINNSTTLNSDSNVKINIQNLLDLNNNSTVYTIDNLIVLKSNNINTARVDILSNDIIIGKVIVERYLQNTKRQWRLLTAPLKGDTFNSVLNNWQNNGVYSSSNIGVDIWGPYGTNLRKSNNLNGNLGNGLVKVINSSYNLRCFNNLTGQWYNIQNTLLETLFDSNINKGFLIFAPYSYLKSRNLLNSAPLGGFQSLTLSSSGNLLIGDILYDNISNNQFYMIGNPYASPIDFTEILAEPENSGIDKVWFIDPTISNYGGYVGWQEGFGYSNSGSIFKTNNAAGPIFQSGEAFFVRATSTTSSLTIKESHKTDATTNSTLNRTSSTTTNSSPYELFRILLEKEIENAYINADGCVAGFYSGGNNGLDTADGGKLSNPGENISLVNNTTLLSIEHRATIQNNDFLTIRISNATIGTNYKLKLYTENFTYDGYAYLQDLFLGTITEVPLDGSTFEYEYQISENTSSVGNRFKVLFQNTVLSETDVITNDFMIYPNPVNNNEFFTIQFSSKTNEIGNYSCRIYNTIGQLLQENNLNIVNGSASIQLNNNFNSGVYFVEINNTAINEKSTKSLIIE